MRRILLLNPPGTRNYSRELLLGTVLEPGARLPPQDLVVLSGALSGRGELSVCDAPAEGLDEAATLARARALAPDVVFFAASGASFAEDSRLLSALKQALPKARLAGVGDLYRELRDMAFLLQPFLDAALFEPAPLGLDAYLRGPAGKPLENLAYRGRNGAPVSEAPRHRSGRWDAPAPRWDLFPLARYRWPLAGEGPRASLLTDFGCPFLCTYCPASAVAHKSRPVEDVLAEARALRALGVRSVIFRDQTFAADRARALALLEGLGRQGPGFSWTASTRVDLADPALLAAMKAAGCETVSFGVDSGSDDALRAYKKNTTRRQAAAAVAAARAAGLRTWGLFVIGLAMDTRESVEATLNFAEELALDHVSVAVESSRFAAGYRRELLVKGLVPPEAMPPDVPTTTSVWQGRLGVSNDDVFGYYERALARFQSR